MGTGPFHIWKTQNSTHDIYGTPSATATVVYGSKSTELLDIFVGSGVGGIIHLKFLSVLFQIGVQIND